MQGLFYEIQVGVGFGPGLRLGWGFTIFSTVHPRNLRPFFDALIQMHLYI